MSDEQPSIKLSKREQQVLELVTTGASNKEIAQQLVISVNTVKVHMRNIFEKMEVQSRTEATTLAIQEKLVSVTEPESGAAGEGNFAPIVAKTFLLRANPPLALPRWQQFYLLLALLPVAIVATIPFFPGETQKSVPNLPVLYTHPTPPAPPPAPSGGNNSRWATQPSMPTRRAGLALAAFKKQLIAIGGVRGNNKTTRSVEIFDTVSGNWTEGDTKPSATTSIAAAVINEKIYVPGGCSDTGRATGTLEIYDPALDSWSSGPPMPAARCGYGLAAYKDTLYLFGGWNGDIFKNTIFAFSTQDGRWEVLEQTLPQPTGFMGAATLNDTIYIAGGYDGNRESDQTFAFSPSTGHLQPKASMLESRGGLGLTTGGNNLYAIGGGWTHSSGSSEKYNPDTDTWETFETPFSGQWRNLGLTSAETSIYAVGGWNGTEEKFMDTVQSYQFIFQLFLPISNSN